MNGFDLRGELYRILALDLTQVPGLQCTTEEAEGKREAGGRASRQRFSE